MPAAAPGRATCLASTLPALHPSGQGRSQGPGSHGLSAITPGSCRAPL